MKRLPVSLILVSDYEPGEKTWADERAALEAFLSDAHGIPDEIIVMESGSSSPPSIPEDIAARAPEVKVRFAEMTSSAGLKDEALQYCSHELVAVVEADCLPFPGWLAALVDEMERDSSLGTVSGRTVYGNETSMMRVMSLLDRGFMEVARHGRYAHVSNNGALYRKDVLERHRYPADEANPFISAEIRGREMKKGGVRFGVCPRALMRHAYGGIPFIIDVRRNKGYQAASMVAKKKPGNPFHIVWRSLWRTSKDDWRTVRHVGPSYGLKWTDWPLLAVVFAAVRVPELAGAWSATRGSEDFATTTNYR